MSRFTYVLVGHCLPVSSGEELKAEPLFLLNIEVAKLRLPRIY